MSALRRTNVGKWLGVSSGIISIALVGTGIYGFLTDKPGYDVVLISGVFVIALVAVAFLAMKRGEPHG